MEPEKQMKSILIVEDDRSIAAALGVRLKNCGYKVEFAPDAMTGVNRALKLRSDLILLDISMPGGSGFSVVERLQRILPTRTPFIILTASKQPGLREQAQELGAAGFFEKPYEAEELLLAIKDILGETAATKH